MYFKKVTGNDIDSKIVLKEALKYASSLEITDVHLNKWIEIFEENVSNPKYQWVYNWLYINTKTFDSDNSWMNEWMPDNACRIYNKFNLTNKESIFSDAHLELRRIFASVNTELSSECWKDTGYLIYEVVVNAYYHGDAGASYIEIHPDMISVVDDGNIFDPKLLLQTDMGRMQGGKNTLKRFVESYPEIELFYQRNKEYNFFTINFGMNVFNINKMSRLSADNQAQHLKLKMRSNTVGEFKYYYFDIKQLNSGENDFASWLPISMQRCIIKQLTVDIPIYEKKSIVFIYFSEIDIEELSDLHTSFYLIAKDFNKKREDLEIKVIPELNFVL